MHLFIRFCQISILTLILFCIRECMNKEFKKMVQKYELVAESYELAEKLFNQGRENYNELKIKSLNVVDTFLDLVEILNSEMACEIRTAIVRFYKIKYFYDFTNYAISMEEMVQITEHCLIEPIEKLSQIRDHFRDVIGNFQDVRNFSTVNKCSEELPDEVATAHCVLHQAVLFNETMQENLASLVKIKTRQHAQDMNSSIYHVQKCLNDFVPNFFDQLLVWAYTSECGYLRVVNASIIDLLNDDWKRNHTVYPMKWSPVVRLLKQDTTQKSKDPLFLTLFAANLSSHDIISTLGTQLRNK